MSAPKPNSRKKTAVTLATNLKRLDRYRDHYNPMRGLSVARCHALVESSTSVPCRTAEVLIERI